ncbi:MAG: hypothetical protein KF799_16245 [Bdellovibrionales bacterium]|nr:hypothetical protein [Bdellovibrionales bacterium]
MRLSRNVSILSILSLTVVTLSQFQNCAPVQPAMQASSSSSDARLIDEFNKAQVQFATSEVQVREDVPAVDINGLCSRSHNGAQLRWTLWATSGDVVARGESRCASGGFNAHVGGLEQVVCGTSYQLVVDGDWGGSASVSFAQRCQPLAMESVGAVEGSPYGTECALEYVPSGESQSPCKQVCYRGNVLMSEMPVEAARCSGMAARLAGP